MATFTYTSANVTVNSNQIYKTQNNAPAFKLSLTAGTVPGNDNWRVTKVKLNLTYQTYTTGETIRLRKGGSTAASARTGSAIATGIKVGAPRSLTLSGSDATNRTNWEDLDGRYIALQGDDSSDNILKTATAITIVVTYEYTNVKVTLTGKSANQVDTGSAITFTFDPGTGVASRSFAATCNGHTVGAAVVNNTNHTVYLNVNSTLNSHIPGTTATATMTVTSTFSDSSQATDSMTFTVHVPDSIVPTDLAITKTINANNTITGTPTLQNVSTVSLSAAATAPAGTTITSYKWTLSDYQHGTGQSWTSAPFKQSGTITVTLKVTDSRGRSATATDTIEVTAYSFPNVLYSGACIRCRDAAGTDESPEEGTYCKVTPVYSYTALAGNTATVTIDWRNTGDADYPAANTVSGNIASGAYQVIGTNIAGGETFDITKEYRVRVTVWDTVSNGLATPVSSEIILEVDKAAAFMVWDGAQNAIGFGCHPQGGNRVEIDPNWDLFLNEENVWQKFVNIGQEFNDIFGRFDTIIGAYYTNTNSSGTSCGNYSNVTICSITDLPAGVYIAEGSVQWPANTSGYRAAALTTNSSLAPAGTYDGTVQTANPNNSVTTLHTSLIFKLTGTGGIYLRQYQNSGGSLTVKGTLHCVRIK